MAERKKKKIFYMTPNHSVIAAYLSHAAKNSVIHCLLLNECAREPNEITHKFLFNYK